MSSAQNQVSCPFCPRDFDSQPALNSHKGQAHDTHVELACEGCGTTFEVKESRVDEARFCSNKCRGDWQQDAFKGDNGPGYNGGKERFECQWCGSEIKQWPSQRGTSFCNHACYGAWRSENNTGENHSRFKGGKDIYECDYCGENFEAHPYRTPRFCSHPCYASWYSDVLVGENNPNYQGRDHSVCKQCGDEFKHRPSKERVFCDLDCRGRWHSENIVGPNHHQWQENVGNYGEGWTPEKRRSVRERDRYQCQGCGLSQEDHLKQFGQKLCVHHITPAREFDDPTKRNAEENLISLCVVCHPKWEHLPGLRPQLM